VIRRLAVLAVSAAAASAAAELAVRLAGLDAWMMESLVGLQEADPEVHRASEDPELLYELVPGFTGTLPPCRGRWCGEPREVAINELGFRDPPRTLARPAGTLRVLCLGGSNTYGAAVSDGDTWPAQLQRELDASTDTPVEVWNLGVSGYMNRQKAALGIRMLAEASPDLILLQTFNVGLRFRLDDGELRPLLAANEGVWRENLVGVPVGGMGRLLWRGSRLVRALGVARNLQRERSDSTARRGELFARASQRDAAAVAELAASARGRAGLVVVIPPAKPADERLIGHGIPVLDMRVPEQPWGEEGRDSHPRGPVYDWYARRIARELVDGGCLERPLSCLQEGP
jgi:hypothetical protein